MNEWFRRPSCGGCKRPAPSALPPADPCALQTPSCRPAGCFLVQRILASGRLHRRRQCYPLCLRGLPSQAREPVTVLDACADGLPRWAECDERGRCGWMIRVTVPLSLRVRDSAGCTYVIPSSLEEQLRLIPEGPAQQCWRGQCFVQAAVRLAGKCCPCGDSPCSVPLEVLIEGYLLSPCTVGRPDAACPPRLPWYPQPLYDPYRD